MNTENNNQKPKKSQQCDSCGGDLVNGVCSRCGWVQIVFPTNVPSGIKTFNGKRKEVSNNLFKKLNEAKDEIERLNKELIKAKEAQKNIAPEDSSDKSLSTAESYSQGQQADNADQSRFLDESKRLNEQIRSLTLQIESIKKENEALIKDNEGLKKENDELSYANNTGTQFIITENKGKYTLYDPSRKVRRANNTLIGMSGIELYNGYTFRFGDIAFTVKVPEINIDDIMLNN